VRVSYEVENWSLAAKSYAPPLCVEKLDRPTLLSFSFTVPHGRSYSWNKEDLEGRDRREDSERVLCVKAEARDVAPRSEGLTHKARMSYELLVPRDHSDILAFTEFTLGAEVVCLNLPEGYDFAVSAGDKNGREWTIASLLAPAEHIRVRWFPKAD